MIPSQCFEYINDYGLLNAKKADIVSENTILFSYTYLLWDHDRYLGLNLFQFIQECHTGTPGLYNQLPFITNGHDDYMSPDQLIGIVGALDFFGHKKDVKKIWRYLLLHFFTYDNISKKTNFKRIMQPSTILFTGAKAGNIICKLLLPIPLIYSCMAKPLETSGKIKAWMMMKSCDLNKTMRFCVKIIKGNEIYYSWKKVFLRYFYESDHPYQKLFS